MALKTRIECPEMGNELPGGFAAKTNIWPALRRPDQGLASVDASVLLPVFAKRVG